MLAALSLSACSRQPAESPEASRVTPTASIHDLMTAQVEPAADLLWKAVSTKLTQQGVEEQRPHSDEEWLALRHAAIRLAEGGNLLLIDGRRVAAAGKVLEDAHVEGFFSAEEIGDAIAKNPEVFRAYAQALRGAGVQALSAIDARDPQALFDAGGAIYQTCNGCHSTFWYPDAPRPAIFATQP